MNRADRRQIESHLGIRMSGPSRIHFSELQERYNNSYYQSRDPKAGTPNERIGFHTPSQAKSYANVNAREFIAHARTKEGRLTIDEFGSADGTFAKNFLDCVRDIAPDVYSRIGYRAWDKYKSLRSTSTSVLADHSNAVTGTADVVMPESQTLVPSSSDWIFCHELFDDLKGRVVSNRSGRLQDLWFRESNVFGASAIENFWEDLSPAADRYDKIREFMRNQHENLRVAIPLDGVRALGALHSLLRSGGKLRVFDYGYPNPDSIGILAVISSNLLTGYDAFLRGYAMVGAKTDGNATAAINTQMQITCPVNFPFLSDVARSLGMGVLTETHLEWASRILGVDQLAPFHCISGLAYRVGNPGFDEPDQQGFPTGATDLIKIHPAFKNDLSELELRRIISNVARGIFDHGIYERMARLGRARNCDMSFEFFPAAQEVEFRASFAPIITELVLLGFDRKALETLLFSYPPQHPMATSSIRVSMTATKT